jgi:hypothetical protein
MASDLRKLAIDVSLLFILKAHGEMLVDRFGF